MSYAGVKVAHIVAATHTGVIGKNGTIPFKIKADLQRFKKLTHEQVVVMGRKTFESLDNKPLPNRVNIVVTSQNLTSDNPLLIYANSIKEAMIAAYNTVIYYCMDCIWIIGGATIYQQTQEYLDVIEGTVVNVNIKDADTYYPRLEREMKQTYQSKNLYDIHTMLNYYYVTQETPKENLN